MTIDPTPALPVAVIGAGPIGLAAAAHLVARGIPIEIFEAGDGIAANLESYRHVQLFSPWNYDIDATAASLLASEPSWEEPAGDVLPTAGEVVDRYLLPLSRLPSIAPHLHVNASVLAVSREGYDKVKTAGREHAPFVLRVQMENGTEEFRASAVIDASGTWSQPSPLGGNGLPALGEIQNRQHIQYGMPDIAGREREQYQGHKTLVVGSGHSAVGSLLALAELAEQNHNTRIVWAVRGQDIAKAFGGGEADGLPARGALGVRLRKLIDEGRLDVRTGFKIRSISRCVDKLSVEPADVQLKGVYCVDRIVGATGARPDHTLSRELRAQFDPWLEGTVQLAPLIDPNVHSCGSVRPHGHRELEHPEPGFYVIGAKSYGRAPNFLMATGFEQARSVVAAIAGDMEAADTVHLELPHTGVCSSRLQGADAADASRCCGPAPAGNTFATSSCCGPARGVTAAPAARSCCVYR